jgi:hypothetical protein
MSNYVRKEKLAEALELDAAEWDEDVLLEVVHAHAVLAKARTRDVKDDGRRRYRVHEEMKDELIHAMGLDTSRTWAWDHLLQKIAALAGLNADQRDPRREELRAALDASSQKHRQELGVALGLVAGDDNGWGDLVRAATALRERAVAAPPSPRYKAQLAAALGLDEGDDHNWGRLLHRVYKLRRRDDEVVINGEVFTRKPAAALKCVCGWGKDGAYKAPEVHNTACPFRTRHPFAAK